MPRPVKFAGRLFGFSLLPLLLVLPLMAASFGGSAIVSVDDEPIDSPAHATPALATPDADGLDADGLDAQATVARYVIE